MPPTLTRRTLMKTAAGGLAVLAGSGAAASYAMQADIDSGGIGLMRADWESIVGEGTASGDLVEYANPEFEGLSIFARFDGSDRVIHLEFVYAENDTGGLSMDDVRAQIDGAMPSDANQMETFLMTPEHEGATLYRAERFTSEQLGATSNGLASILVIAQLQSGSGESSVTRVSLSMPGPHTMEAREVGNPGGIGLPQAEWNTLYGEPVDGENVYENEVVPDFQLLVQFEPEDRANLVTTTVDGEMTPIVGYADAKGLVGSLLPDDAILRDVYQVPSTPERMTALLAEMWECPSLADVTDEAGSVLALYEQATDTSPVTVSRVFVALPVKAEEGEEATPAASPGTTSATPIASPAS